MCLDNGENVSLSFLGWIELFPRGVPLMYTIGAPLTEEYWAKIKKGNGNVPTSKAITKNADAALRDDWSLRTPNFTWLNAPKNFSRGDEQGEGVRPGDLDREIK